MPEPFFVEGDPAATLQANCTDKASGAAINLTGKTVTLWFNYFGVPAVSKTMTVTDAAGGVAKYTFLAGDMVNSYNVRTFEAPVTKDHEQEGPAYGWVSAIKREGATLLTKFSQVSETLKNWIKTGAYKKRSAEIYKNFQGT